MQSNGAVFVDIGVGVEKHEFSHTRHIARPLTENTFLTSIGWLIIFSSTSRLIDKLIHLVSHGAHSLGAVLGQRQKQLRDVVDVLRST